MGSPTTPTCFTQQSNVTPSKWFLNHTNLFHSTINHHLAKGSSTTPTYFTWQLSPCKGFLYYQLISPDNQPSPCKGFLYYQLISLDNQPSPCKRFLYHTSLFHSTINHPLLKDSSITPTYFTPQSNITPSKGFLYYTNLFHSTVIHHTFHRIPLAHQLISLNSQITSLNSEKSTMNLAKASSITPNYFTEQQHVVPSKGCLYHTKLFHWTATCCTFQRVSLSHQLIPLSSQTPHLPKCFSITPNNFIQQWIITNSTCWTSEL